MSTKDGGATGTVVQVPYPTRSDAESAMPPAKKEDASEGGEAAEALGLEEEKAKEKARKVINALLLCGLFCCIVLQLLYFLLEVYNELASGTNCIARAIPLHVELQRGAPSSREGVSRVAC